MPLESARRFASSLVLAACTAFVAAPAGAQTVGATLPKWTPGTLDIHHINTGRGNATFFMLPDGTTLLVDAGDGGPGPPRGTPPRPDGSQPPAEWIARYVRTTGASQIDYGYLTHFHSDHMNAMVDVAGKIPVQTMIDRGWPSYDYPAADHRELTAPSFLKYREFLGESMKTGAVKPLRLVAGRNDQIVLVKDPKKYPEFEVRNIAANGEVWTGGTTSASRRLFPDLTGLAREDWPTENMCSLAIRLRYGAFDYFTGGDMPGNFHVWSSDHPAHDVLERLYSTRLYPGPRDVFATNMIEANRIVIGPLLDQLKSAQGHIVVRVAPGGGTYTVIILEDSAETHAVKAVHGPYDAR
jgi:hypothetical protein